MEPPRGGRCVTASPCVVVDTLQPFLPDEPERSAAAVPAPRSEQVISIDTGRFFGFAEAGDRVGFGQGPFGDLYYGYYGGHYRV
jgi:hypothetical protein